MAEMAYDFRQARTPEQLERMVDGIIAKRVSFDHGPLLARILELAGIEKNMTPDQVAGLALKLDNAALDVGPEVGAAYTSAAQGVRGCFTLIGGLGPGAQLKGMSELLGRLPQLRR